MLFATDQPGVVLRERLGHGRDEVYRAGSAASVIARERGWARSVPWSVTAALVPLRRERRPGGQPEVGVDDVEALSLGASAQVGRRLRA